MKSLDTNLTQKAEEFAARLIADHEARENSNSTLRKRLAVALKSHAELERKYLIGEATATMLAEKTAEIGAIKNALVYTSDDDWRFEGATALAQDAQQKSKVILALNHETVAVIRDSLIKEIGNYFPANLIETVIGNFSTAMATQRAFMGQHSGFIDFQWESGPDHTVVLRRSFSPSYALSEWTRVTKSLLLVEARHAEVLKNFK